MRTGWRQSTIGQLQPSSLRDSSQSNDRTTLELDGQLIEAGNSALSVGFGSYQTLTVARASICMHVYARLGTYRAGPVGAYGRSSTCIRAQIRQIMADFEPAIDMRLGPLRVRALVLVF